jgi:hypothetical protein
MLWKAQLARLSYSLDGRSLIPSEKVIFRRMSWSSHTAVYSYFGGKVPATDWTGGWWWSKS